MERPPETAPKTNSLAPEFIPRFLHMIDVEYRVRVISVS